MFQAPPIKHALLATVAITALAFTSTGWAGSNEAKPNAVTPEARDAANSIFAERCAVCHGDDGGGSGPGAANLNPKPQNFRSRKWQKSMTDQQIAMIIVNGGR